MPLLCVLMILAGVVAMYFGARRLVSYVTHARSTNTDVPYAVLRQAALVECLNLAIFFTWTGVWSFLLMQT